MYKSLEAYLLDLLKRVCIYITSSKNFVVAISELQVIQLLNNNDD